MIIDVVTIFPRMFDSPFAESIIHRAQEQGQLQLRIHNLRDYCLDRHRVVDDYPYGGGAGMVMRPEPAFRAIQHLRGENFSGEVILPSPAGEPFSQRVAEKLSRLPQLIIFCPHYEGLDERVSTLVDREISLGDYVLTGGELPAMVMIDAVVRLQPGVLGSAESLAEESFSPLLEYPHYTRPAQFAGLQVPEVLLSGHHVRIREWRRRQALRRTLSRRPDLLVDAQLTAQEEALLADWREQDKNLEEV
ncbi:MAG: tRNA (guanosine(37)-N1)-methyltransferase TrmD [Deltaproteobacteria bacterium]|nr:tRNA (guanosine(37)-N1)-methyltransferase TrmD [Deltaproteobacteria bacterium]